MSKELNRLEYITGNMLDDLGFELIEPGDDFTDYRFEVGYRHPWLDPFNLILVDYKNGAWHFAQRKHSMNGIGKMTWLDDLIIGMKFVTNCNILHYPKREP